MKDHDTCPRALLTNNRPMSSAMDHTRRSHFVKIVPMAAVTSQPGFPNPLLLSRIH